MSDSRIFKYLVSAVVLVVLALVGVLLTTVVAPDLEIQLAQGLAANFELENEDSASYNSWAKSSDPDAAVVISSYFLYSIVNPDAVLTGAAPELVEVGPLSYTYNNFKYNVSWDPAESGDVVSFKQYQYYTSSGPGTNALGDTLVTTLNVPLLSVLANPLAVQVVAGTPQLASLYLQNASTLFITRKASEIAFGWVNDSFLMDFNAYKPSWFPALPTFFQGLQNNDSSLEFALATHSPIRMRTGVVTPQALMQYISWDGAATMQCCEFGPCGDAGSGGGLVEPWATLDANQISGSEGGQFQVGVTPADVLRVATYDFGIYRHWNMVCDDLPADGAVSAARPSEVDADGQRSDADGQRQLSAALRSDLPRVDGDSNVGADAGGGGLGAVVPDFVSGYLQEPHSYEVEQITVLRFVLPAHTLGSASTNPAEAAAYTNFGPAGLLNQSLCESGAQIFLSKPRFLDGDPSLSGALKDFPVPTREAHDTWLGVEPITGSTLDFHFRIGVNIWLQPYVGKVTLPFLDPVAYAFYPSLAPLYFPLMWGSQDSTVTDAQAQQFRSQVYLAVTVIKAVYWGGVAFAGACGLAALALVVAALCRRRALSSRARAARRGGGAGLSSLNAGGGGGGERDFDEFLLPGGGLEQEYEYGAGGDGTASVVGGGGGDEDLLHGWQGQQQQHRGSVSHSLVSAILPGPGEEAQQQQLSSPPKVLQSLQVKQASFAGSRT